MALLNYSNREINAKIVYYGPGLSGKTTNIDCVYRKLRPDQKGKLVSLATQTDRTLFFDFLPIEVGEIKGFKTRFHLYTVPGQVFYDATRKMVLKGSDGVVFVADSQKQMMDVNIESLKNLEENLKAYGKSLDQLPHVIQFNKRDIPDVVSLEEMYKKLNKYNAPFFEAVATEGKGVMETLSVVSKMVLRSLREKPEPVPSGEIAPEIESEDTGKTGVELAVTPEPILTRIDDAGNLQTGIVERIADNLFKIPFKFRLKDMERKFSISISVEVEEHDSPTDDNIISSDVESAPMTSEEAEEHVLVDKWLKKEKIFRHQDDENDLTINSQKENEQ